MRPDYYSILQIPKSAGAEEIKAAFRRLAMKLHPDKNPHDPSADDKFRQLLEAYEVLGDPEKKRKYDAGRHYFERYEKHGAAFKTTRNNQKDYSFTEQDLKNRQEIAKQYREKLKKKQQAETASLPSYSDFKYIMISIPLAIALLFFVINFLNPDDEHKLTDAQLKKLNERVIHPKAADTAAVKQYIPEDTLPLTDGLRPNMHISPWNKIFGPPAADSASGVVIRIENRSGTDAVIGLYDEVKRKTIRNHYIYDNYYLLLDMIPKGRYHLKVVYGKNWNTANATTEFTYEGMFDSVFVYSKMILPEQVIKLKASDLERKDTLVRVLEPWEKTRAHSRINNREFFWR